MATNSAEYMRQYRKTVKPMKEREAQRSGVEQVVLYLREKVGTRQLTGLKMAQEIERVMLAESPDVLARQRFLDTLRQS